MHCPVRPLGALDTKTHMDSAMSTRPASEIGGDALFQRIRCSDTGVLSARSPAPGSATSSEPMTPYTPASPWHTPRFDAHDDAPILLLDTRPSHSFSGCAYGSEGGGCARAGHVKGSINLQVPTLLLRRTHRGLGGGSPAAMPSDFSLSSYIHSDAGTRRLNEVRALRTRQLHRDIVHHPHFQALFDVYWFTDIVVLFEESDGETPGAASQRQDCSSFAGRMLLQLLEALQESRAELAAANPLLRDARRGLYYVRGGLHALRQTPGSAEFFTAPQPSEEALSPRSAPEQAAAGPALALSPPRSPGGRPSAMAPTPLALPHAAVEARRASKPSLPRLNTGLRDAPPIPTRISETTSAAPRHSLKPLDLSGLPVSAAPLSARRATAPDLLNTAHDQDDWSEFNVSTIIPGFLYFGSNITNDDHVQQLQRLGVRAILNTALEIEDGGAPELALRTQFRDYLRIPLRDVVEQPDVQQRLAEACAFLDRAWLYSCPAYVHCRAGKSRSAMIVMAYLIHAHRWTLQQAYAHVAQRRTTTSPNIGFLAELMHFERETLGARRAGAPRASPGNAQSAPVLDTRARSASVSPRRPLFAEQPRRPDEGPGELLGGEGHYRIPSMPRDAPSKRNSIAALGSNEPSPFEK